MEHCEKSALRGIKKEDKKTSMNNMFQKEIEVERLCTGTFANMG